MLDNCQDAMAIFRMFGYPDLFLTMTCNPKWPEIDRQVREFGLSAYDRPDIACRVFKAKLDMLMADFKKGDFFGRVNAGTTIFHGLIFFFAQYQLFNIYWLNCTFSP